MNDRETFDTQQEAKRETLGKVSQSTRERMFGALDKYLTAEAAHARKAAKAESRRAPRRSA